MRRWLKIRESLIRGWHWVSDYDTKMSDAKAAKTAKARAKSQAERFRTDAVKTEANRRKLENKEQAWQTRIQDLRQQKHLDDTQPEDFSAINRCPGCGRRMVAQSRKTDSSSGCLILILGLALTPVLIGIPIILVGIHYMGKKEKFWGCSHCGV